jgi:hypothetical protein
VVIQMARYATFLEIVCLIKYYSQFLNLHTTQGPVEPYVKSGVNFKDFLIHLYIFKFPVLSAFKRAQIRLILLEIYKKTKQIFSR